MLKYDHTGQRFGRWAVVGRAPNKYSMKQSYWLCRCDCGTERSVNGQQLRLGGSQSCGCYRRENPNRRTHGMRRTREYRIWMNMKYRCENSTFIGFANYGGRGIAVCDRWRNRFQAFYDDMGPCPSGKHSIDRINNDGNYELGNCRWATPKEQARNRRPRTAMKI